MAAQGNVKGPLLVSHTRVSKSLGFYLIKIVSAWYNKHRADEKDYGDVQNVPGPKAAGAQRPWVSDLAGSDCVLFYAGNTDLLAHF